MTRAAEIAGRLTTAQRHEAVEAMLVAEHRDCPAMWPDGYTDGVARIKRMKAEWALDGLLAHLQAMDPKG